MVFLAGAVFLFGTGWRVLEDGTLPPTRIALHTEQWLTVANRLVVSAMIKKFEFLLQGN